MKIRPIILASGFSRRFGGNKLLYPFKGKPLFRHILDTLLKMEQEKAIEKIIIVTQYLEILEDIKKDHIQGILNTNADYGMSEALKLGTDFSYKENADTYFMFFTADQPFLQSDTIINFINAFINSKKEIGCAKSKERIGNPAIFHPKYYHEIMALKGENGGKEIINNHLDQVFFFDISETELIDIDTKKGTL